MNLIENYYDKLAKDYDKITTGYGRWAAPKMVANLVQKYWVADAEILDIGIGTGACIEPIYNYSFKSILGIDISEKMLAICRHKFPKVTLIHGDFFKVHCSISSTFSLIICAGVLDFIEDINAFFDAIYALLRPGSPFIFTFEPVICGYAQQELDVSRSLGDVHGRFSHRHSLINIFNALAKRGFNVEDHYEFAAYVNRKSNNSLIFNHIISACRLY